MVKRGYRLVHHTERVRVAKWQYVDDTWQWSVTWLLSHGRCVLFHTKSSVIAGIMGNTRFTDD
jgi:hypothetical protein